jgi:LmbE family N-acetylglucosaminyl deacetylase
MMRRALAQLVRLFGLASLVTSGCVHPPPREPPATDVLVIAPHPDDEVLLAGGVLERALKAGQHAAVIIVTNGDYGCDADRDGFVREGESITALTALGLAEEDVHFLGYPDGHLKELGATPLAAVDRRDRDGHCGKGATTCAWRGAGRVDEHTARTGTPAAYTSQALTQDLTALLERLRPRDVYVVHGIDTHPDHAMTYVFFRRALDQLAQAPRVHRGVVHQGRCWPSTCHPYFDPTAPLAPLPPPLDAYVPAERLPTDAHRKLALISKYPSQTGAVVTEDWLSSFARPEEVFFPEQYERRDGHWLRTAVTRAPAPLHAADGTTLRLDPRPDEHVTERTLWGPEGLLELTVLPDLTSPGTPSSSD